MQCTLINCYGLIHIFYKVYHDILIRFIVIITMSIISHSLATKLNTDFSLSLTLSLHTFSHSDVCIKSNQNTGTQFITRGPWALSFT